MPTKKGKSKPAKAKKASNATRRTRTGTAKGKATTKKRAGTAAKGGVRKKAAGKLRRTEAGPVWIGKSNPLMGTGQDKGGEKAGGGERVVIL